MKRENLSLLLLEPVSSRRRLMLIAFPGASESAEEPPAQGCQAVTKQNTTAPKKRRLTAGLGISTYVQSGRNRTASLLVLQRVARLDRVPRTRRVERWMRSDANGRMKMFCSSMSASDGLEAAARTGRADTFTQWMCTALYFCPGP